MTNPTQAASAASTKPSPNVADDRNKTHTDAQNDKASMADQASQANQPHPGGKPDAGVKSEPVVSAKV